MNKISFTKDRLFMALVGPGGSGELLVHSMLASPTFYPPIEKTFYDYKEYQPLFQEMSERLNIESIPCVDFEMIKILKNKRLSNLQLPVDTGNSVAFLSKKLIPSK